MLWPHTKTLVVFDFQLTIRYGEMKIAKLQIEDFLLLETTSFLF